MILPALSACSWRERSVRTGAEATSGLDGEAQARGAAGSSSGAQASTEPAAVMLPVQQEAPDPAAPGAGEMPGSNGAELPPTAQATFRASWVWRG